MDINEIIKKAASKKTTENAAPTVSRPDTSAMAVSSSSGK